MNQPTTLPGPAEPEVHLGKWKFAITFTSLCTAQGLYYLIIGLWPLISLDTFEAVTGEKRDHWLVKTVGVLVAVQAAVLLLAAWRRQPSLEVTVLALGTAAALALIDVIYSAGRVISLVYLVDGLLQGALIAGWLRYLVAHRRTGGAGSGALPGPPNAPR